MAGLPVLKKCGKIQNVVSSSDFEIFSPEIDALVLYKMIHNQMEFIKTIFSMYVENLFQFSFNFEAFLPF